ncbi:uncharacterized protein K444DRAFT_629885 [Hyaloscypha bicolor E]|uniref:2EXR domain-containing protein n=1 Tax=Hyaloscypha bicolor E TaxID=1095630 RepID=A0A2J6TAI2_9HELO|nr:uncharacterized protein K444DRAFT_629885 [Hyaloscypha bicolor E]PMD60044.1 hypothetical protein K444DRAFT_629885 [Hyaloscypha bicolor E]
MSSPRSPQPIEDVDTYNEMPESQSSPFAIFPQAEAVTPPLPFSTVATPTALVERAHIVLGPHGKFPLFPFFPTEIRLKIWKANLRPQILQVIYDITLESHRRRTYMHGRQYRAAWRFMSSPAANMPNRFICQESRAEAGKETTGYELVRLMDDAAEARWFNYDIDSVFLDTNAESHSPYDGEDYDPYVDNVLPPLGHPFLHGTRLRRNLKVLAVSDTLWTDWPFSADNGSVASCEMCPGFRWDNTKDDFKKMVEKMVCLEKLQVVRTGNRPDGGSGGLKLGKRNEEDPYGISLLRRVNEWKEEKGLKMEVEVLELVG